MARPKIIESQALAEVARAAFLEQGYGVSTAEIARRAGISEGTLFSRFGTKEELFERAVGLSDYGEWRSALEGQAGQGEVRRNLERAAALYLEEAKELSALLMLVLSRGLAPEHNPMLERVAEPFEVDRAMMATYLREEMRLERIRPIDTHIAASSIMGALGQWIHQCRMSDAAANADAEIPDSGRFVRAFFDLLWPGLKP